MSLLMQILSGTLCLALCSIAHVMVLAICLPHLRTLGKSLSRRSAYARMVQKIHNKMGIKLGKSKKSSPAIVAVTGKDAKWLETCDSHLILLQG